MTTSTASCIRGCNLYRQHLTDCEHPADDDPSCRGCLPRRATEGLLCHPCHRRLELMLTDFPTIDRWLTGNINGAAGTDYDRPFITGTKGDGPPLPFRAGIYDARQLIADQLTELVDDMCETHDLRGPLQHTVEADARWLLVWLYTLEREPWIGDWWGTLAESTSAAHALVPWRPAMRRLPGVPCPGCAETNLGIFGGESDVSCMSCGILMTEARFEMWAEVLKLKDEEAEAS